MTGFASIFTDINLPNPTTWFYFSGLLAVALFFKFGRVLSLRNLDVLALYLFGPGFLLLAESARLREAAVGMGPDAAKELLAEATWYVWSGYGCLLLASLYFLGRCLLDLSLERRPALGTNLDLSGLAWLAGALFISLVAVAARQPDRTRPPQPAKPTDAPPKLVARALPDVSLKLAERSLALACHLSVVVGLIVIGWRVFEDVRSGMAAATFYLLLPYTFFLVPDSPVEVGRWDHAWPMALMVWSVVAYRLPLLAGAFLGVATGQSYFLVVALPAWLSFYYQRGAVRFLVGFVVAAALSVALIGGLAWWYGGEVPPALRSNWATWDWLPWNPPTQRSTGLWQTIPGMDGRSMTAYRLPVFLVSMALVLGSAVWPRPKNLAHVLALTAASLISIQFWFDDQGGAYVLWFLPLVLLIVFRPNMAEMRAPELPPDGWPVKLGGMLLSLLSRLLPAEPKPVAVPGPGEPDAVTRP